MVLTWWRRDKHDKNFYDMSDLQKFDEMMKFLNRTIQVDFEGIPSFHLPINGCYGHSSKQVDVRILV